LPAAGTPGSAARLPVPETSTALSMSFMAATLEGATSSTAGSSRRSNSTRPLPVRTRPIR
jgi:hypothetical protein